MGTDTEPRRWTWAEYMTGGWVDPRALLDVSPGTEDAAEVLAVLLDAERDVADTEARYAGTEDAEASAYAAALRGATVGALEVLDARTGGRRVAEVLATFPDGSRFRLQVLPDGTATGAYAVDGGTFHPSAVADALDVLRGRLADRATGDGDARTAAAWAYAEALAVLADLDPVDVATRVADTVAEAWAAFTEDAVAAVALAAEGAAVAPVRSAVRDAAAPVRDAARAARGVRA